MAYIKSITPSSDFSIVIVVIIMDNLLDCIVCTPLVLYYYSSRSA